MLTLPQQIIDDIVAQAQEEAPNECCGIIAGKDGRATKLFQARHDEASPSRYTVDTDDLVRISRECA